MTDTNIPPNKPQWQCGRCYQEEKGLKVTIPEHFRTCAKRDTPDITEPQITFNDSTKEVFRIESDGSVFWRKNGKMVQAKTDKDLGKALCEALKVCNQIAKDGLANEEKLTKLERGLRIVASKLTMNPVSLEDRHMIETIEYIDSLLRSTPNE